MKYYRLQQEVVVTILMHPILQRLHLLVLYQHLLLLLLLHQSPHQKVLHFPLSALEAVVHLKGHPLQKVHLLFLLHHQVVVVVVYLLLLLLRIYLMHLLMIHQMMLHLVVETDQIYYLVFKDLERVD